MQDRRLRRIPLIVSLFPRDGMPSEIPREASGEAQSSLATSAVVLVIAVVLAGQRPVYVELSVIRPRHVRARAAATAHHLACLDLLQVVMHGLTKCVGSKQDTRSDAPRPTLTLD